MKNLEEQINRTKDLINIVKLSDLRDAGTWSPRTMNYLKDGALKYYYIDGKFTTEHPGGKKEPKVFFLTPKSADVLNKRIELTKQKKEDYQSYLGITNELMMSLIGDKITI